MQRRKISILAFLGAVVVFSSPVWGGDSDAKSAADRLDKGYEAARRGYWQEAMAQYELASKLAPGNAEIWSNLAIALEAVGRWDEAGDAYRRALEIEPGNSKIRKNVVLYNEFYASYIAVKEPKEKETESELPDDEPDADESSADAPAEENSEEGARDVKKS